LVDAAFHGRPASELVQETVDALQGATPADAQHLLAAFGVKTIGDFATNRLVRAAQIIHTAYSDIGHDPGPDPNWSAFFSRAPLAAYQACPTQFRLDFGPVYYRGRLDSTARVLIVGQDPAANELVGNRIFVGASGQRIQRFLEKLGIRRDYVMINTFLYPVFGQVMGHDLEDISHTDEIMGYRNELLDRLVAENRIEVILTVGGAAKDAVEHWRKPLELPVQAITHPSARDNAALLANWNQGLEALLEIVQPEPSVIQDPEPYGDDWSPEDMIPIPRYDLPFGTPAWHGVGSHASRAKKSNGRADHKRITWRAP
jgi:uracil-DNA glycosylase